MPRRESDLGEAETTGADVKLVSMTKAKKTFFISVLQNSQLNESVRADP